MMAPRRFVRPELRSAKARDAGWNSILKSKYGLTPTMYDGMLAAQGGGCAICGTAPSTRRLAVDHDHRTNENRGLLCRDCNVGLGCFKDMTGRLAAAADYLQRVR